MIFANCIFLALDKEFESVTAVADQVDFVFLLIYTIEMILKIIAMGFFMRAHSYLRDPWNVVSREHLFYYLTDSFFHNSWTS